LAPCAALAARLVVGVLAERRGAGRIVQEFVAGEASAWRFAVRRVPGWGGPWALVPVTVGRLPGCPVCGPTRGEASGLEDLLREVTR
jgi:hypothetical protein